MFIKRCSVPIGTIVEPDQLKEDFPNFHRRLAGINAVMLNPEKFMYIRNRAVSSIENHGFNQNWDGFPGEELQTRHLTFVGSRVSVDHQDDVIIGNILDSRFIEPEYENDKFLRGDFVENIHVIDKEIAESLRPGLIDGIRNGTVIDSSMGAIVTKTECNICNNIAEDESQFCEHIKYSKGSKIKTASGEEMDAGEICHGVTFFEDSIIIPYGIGIEANAGGQGADSSAKLLEHIASKIDNRIQSKEQLCNDMDSIMRIFRGSLDDEGQRKFDSLINHIQKQ